MRSHFDPYPGTRPTLTVKLCLAITVVFLLVDLYYLARWFELRHDQKVLDTLVSLLPPATFLASYRIPSDHRILIVQHFPAKHSRLERASLVSHQAYAQAWGYAYESDTGDYTDRVGRSGVHASLNKLYALQTAVRRELVDPLGAEWIVYCDADTIVSDPSIGLHHLLPPDTLNPQPLMIAGQDHNGLSAGAFGVRVMSETAEFLESVLAPNSVEDGHSDQHHLGRALRSPEGASFAGAFYEIPRMWVNAYFLDNDATYAINEEGDGWYPVWQVHLVDHLKFKYSFRTLLEQAIEVTTEALALQADVKIAGRRSGALAVRNAMELLPSTAWTIRRAREHWEIVEPGIDGMLFLDEVHGVVNANGVVLP